MEARGNAPGTSSARPAFLGILRSDSPPRVFLGAAQIRRELVVIVPGAGGLLEPFAEVAAPRGKIVIYGLLEAASTPMPWFPLLDKSLSIVGYTILDFFESNTRRTSPEAEKIDAAVAFLRARLASGALVPVIAKTFPLAEIAEAHRFMESNQQIGKIVVTTRRVADSLTN